MKTTTVIGLTCSGFLILISICSLIQCEAQGSLLVPAPDSPIPVGPGSGEVVLVDLNRDGHLDILTKHLLTQSVAVRLGDGKGRFKPLAERPMELPYQPGAIALGDVNNDGVLDLGIANKDTKKEYVNILLGNGRGAFEAFSSPITTSPAMEFYKPFLRFVDVNEDQMTDIVTANGRRNSVEILFGNGKGGFSAGQTLKIGTDHDRSFLEVGDVDGDRHLDLVIAIAATADNNPGRLVIKRGNGKGSFSDPTASSPLPSAPRIAALSDVNGDQHLDIVLSHSRHLTVLLNNGKGAFTPASASPYNIGAEPFAAVVADVNRDKKNDLVAATVNSVTVLLSENETFVAAPGSPFRAGPGAYNIAVGDLNEDGKLDVAASSFEGNAVTLLMGR